MANLIETVHGKSHLGGHLNKTHTDDSIINFIKYEYDIKSILDIGCGPGGMSQVCLNEGFSFMQSMGDFILYV